MGQVRSADVSPRGEYERPWRHIAADLRAKIRAGRWQPGDRLPTMAELQHEYGRSKNTVAGAINQLRTEGLIVTRGKSLYVQNPLPPPPEQYQ
jgi:GntR family transcriptional regulator